jgi:hypothetical protein
VIEVQTPVIHAARITPMEREVGHPPLIIRTPGACYIFQRRDQEGCWSRWTAGNPLKSRYR